MLRRLNVFFTVSVEDDAAFGDGDVIEPPLIEPFRACVVPMEATFWAMDASAVLRLGVDFLPLFDLAGSAR